MIEKSPRRVIVLGATGSIGTTFFTSIRTHSLNIIIEAIAAYKNSEGLKAIQDEFNVPKAMLFKDKTNSEIEEFISLANADIVLNGIAGSDGLFATLCALKCGKDVALANKESVVMGGHFLFDFAREHNSRIIPVDSEHSAIYNLINNTPNVDSIVITASGGPFVDRYDTSNVTVTEALNHPTWKMGRKITIDSATLANKGLEVIEASYLFNMPSDRIEVSIHRQSIVHSLVRTKEGAVYAQMSPPDMALPIMAAIADKRIPLESIVKPLSFANLALTFESPDLKRFPMLALAYASLEKGGSYPIAYNASNEVAVNAFLDGAIRFDDIAIVVKNTLLHDFTIECNNFEEIIKEDEKARSIAKDMICSPT